MFGFAILPNAKELFDVYDVNLVPTTIVINKEGEIIISVIDSGIGMSEKNRNKLFKIEEHHTTLGTNNEVGSGVGLILCKELVEKNGGKIWVESELGKGSDFKFTIPLGKKKLKV